MILKSKTENYYTATARNVITISISNQSLNAKSTKKYSNSICVINDSCLAEHIKATTIVNIYVPVFTANFNYYATNKHISPSCLTVLLSDKKYLARSK